MRDPADTDVVTVVMACRDAAATLPAQLEALAGQQLPPELDGRWQLLVCDDGSSDGSRALALAFADRLPLRVLAVPPGDVPAGDVPAGDVTGGRGPGAARNVGAALARSPLLAFCDADDVVAADWLARMVAALAEHPFVAGRFDTGLNSAAVLRSRSLEQQDRLQGGSGGLPHAGGGNLGIHREVFERVGGFDPTLRCLEDTDLSWRVQRAGVPLTFAVDVVVQVRLRSTLPGMFRQGRAYGAAYAELERRAVDRGEPGPGAAADSSPGDSGGRGGRDGGGDRVGRLQAWWGSPPDPGHLVWQLGWWLGHRVG